MRMPTPSRTLRTAFALQVVLAAVLVAAPARAQVDPNVARGFSPEKVYSFGDLDQVNLFNGNLTLTLPIGPGFQVDGGLSYGFTLVYNSNVWDLDTRTDTAGPGPADDITWERARPNAFANAGMGWTLNMGRLHPPGSPGNPDSDLWLYVGEDGGSHSFWPSLHIGEPAEADFRYTRDGSYLRLHLLSDTVAEVEFPGGTVRRFEKFDLDPSDENDEETYQLEEIRDRFGNIVDVNESATAWVVTDPYRSQRIEFTTVAGMRVVDRVLLSEFGHPIPTAEWDFTYADREIARSCWDRDPDTEDRLHVPLLVSVTLPDDSSFRMDELDDYYTECAPDLDHLPGVLRHLVLPTLGELAWTYRPYTFPMRSGGPPDQGGLLSITETVGVATKRASEVGDACPVVGGVGCTWTYTPDPGAAGSPERTTTVRYPSGDETVFYFSEDVAIQNNWEGWHYGLPFKPPPLGPNPPADPGPYLSRRIFDGTAASGTQVRSVYLGYEHDRLPACSTGCPEGWINTNRRVAVTKTVYDDDGGRTTLVTSSQFDGVGHHRRATTTGSADLGPNRTSHTAFNPGRGTYAYDPITNQPAPAHSYQPWPSSAAWVLGTFKETWTQDTGAALVRAQFCFDGATGFLKRVRRLAGASEGGDDLLAVYTRDAGGNVVLEQYYGGDGAGLDNTPANDVCAVDLPAQDAYRIAHTYSDGALATSRYLRADGSGMGFFTIEQTIDAGSGLPAKSTDTAGVETDFEYDRLSRPTWVKPTSPTDDAWTEYEYKPAMNGNPDGLARVFVRRRPNGNENGTALQEADLSVDGQGRPVRDQRKMPGGVWSTVLTTHNSLGQVAKVSERMVGNNPSEKTEYINFDPFGRPRTIRPPDGSTHDVDLSYFGVRLVDRTVSIGTEIDSSSVITEHPSTTSEFYDRYGRLVRVREPSGEGGANVNTYYTYDSADRLVQVHTVSDQGIVQNRYFNYDGRGLLLSETHPEKGASGNGTVHYSGYDARGHAGRIREGTVGGKFDLKFSYDRAERLIEIREHGGAQRPLKEFTYGTSESPADRSKGKLKTAVRHNWVVPPGGTIEIDASVAETYVYGGRGGRVSARTTTAGFGPPFSFNQGWQYDPLGNVERRTYPSCSFTPCAQQTANRSVDFGYTEGLLTSVPGHTDTVPGQPAGTGLTYHPNGMLHQLQHANGVTYIQENDPHSMRRPGSLRVEGQTAPPPFAESQLGTLPGLVYSYDGAGNVVGLGDERYIYDPVSRIVRGNMALPSYSQSYLYDAFGNIGVIATSRGTIATTRYINFDATTNHISGITYDDAGNQLNWGYYAFGYDSFNMMRYLDGGGNDAIYVYTADDERFYVLDVVPDPDREVFYLRDLDGKVLRAFLDRGGVDGDWTETTDYVYRNGALLASVRPSEGVRHFHPDHLGSPRMITDSSGTVLALHAYFPFGEELADGADTEPMKFTGHERDFNNDPATTDDFDYMHARYYTSWLGRFFSFDPVGGNPPAPQSWNRYTYVLNSPLRFLDPLGNRGESPDSAFDEEITVCEEAETGLPCKPDQPSRFSFTAEWAGFLAEIEAFQSSRSDPRIRDMSVQDFANAYRMEFGMGDCSDFTCQVMATVARDTYTGTMYIEKGAILATQFYMFSGAGALSILGESAGSFSLFGATDTGFAIYKYSRAGGYGLNYLKNGRRVFAIDWHRFKLGGKLVNRPHYHVGKTANQLGKHRPWQGGWLPP